MKREKSRSHSAFFNLSALLALGSCLVVGALGIFALKSATHQNVGEQTLNAPENGEEPDRYMPIPGGKHGSEAKDLARAEQAWSDRLTYPTGKFSPGWVRA